jgi:hypothetical protein
MSEDHEYNEKQTKRRKCFQNLQALLTNLMGCYEIYVKWKRIGVPPLLFFKTLHLKTWL